MGGCGWWGRHQVGENTAAPLFPAGALWHDRVSSRTAAVREVFSRASFRPCRPTLAAQGAEEDLFSLVPPSISPYSLAPACLDFSEFRVHLFSFSDFNFEKRERKEIVHVVSVCGRHLLLTDRAVGSWGTRTCRTEGEGPPGGPAPWLAHRHLDASMSLLWELFRALAWPLGQSVFLWLTLFRGCHGLKK